MPEKRIRRPLPRCLRAVAGSTRLRRPRLSVTPSQVTALRGAVRALVWGVDVIPLTLNDGQWSEARRLRWRFECLFRLLDDLGWSDEEPAASTAITMSPCELATALAEISRHSREMIVVDLPEDPDDAAAEVARHHEAVVTCRALRQQIPFATPVGVRGWWWL